MSYSRFRFILRMKYADLHPHRGAYIYYSTLSLPNHLCLDACRGNKFQLLSDFRFFHYSRALHTHAHISHKPSFNRKTKHIPCAITRMHNELSILLHYFSIIWKHEKRKVEAQKLSHLQHKVAETCFCFRQSMVSDSDSFVI